MSFWIPGFALHEGPDSTGVPLRYIAQRDTDGALAWIRVDGHPPDDRDAAKAIAAVYAATARFDHPELPAVLEYGFTAVAGRPFIAFQLDRFRRTGADALFMRSPDQIFELLAELQWLALESGLAGLHIPAHELRRVRSRYITERRRLPIWEFLAEPRRADGVSALAGVEDEADWVPFTAPEMCSRQRHKTSVRAANVYRTSAQIQFLLSGSAPGEAVDTVGAIRPGDPEIARVVRLGLSRNPARRPSLERFLRGRSEDTHMIAIAGANE